MTRAVAVVVGLVVCVLSGAPAAAQLEICLRQSDCNDGNECTLDTCLGVPVGLCLHLGDGCNDGNPCTDDHCNTNGRECVHVAAPAGAACDDGDPFTFGERCDRDGECRLVSREQCFTDDQCPIAFFCNSDGECVVRPLALTATPTATRTPSRTPTVTATRSRTRTPTPTATRTSTPTPRLISTLTPTLAPTRKRITPALTCAGDCNGNHEVTVDELIKGVNITLGTVLLIECPIVDVDLNGEVTVNELIAAVNEALNGCP